MPTNGFTEVGTRHLLDLGFLDVTLREIATPAGDTVERVVVEHPGAAAVVALVEGDVVLIEQHRAAIGRRTLEIPAGKLDDGLDDPAATAARELEEETGYRASHLTHLTDIFTSVGFCDERIDIFLAADLEPGERNPIGPEEVDASVIRMPFGRAVDLVLDGTIKDSKTIVGILFAARRGPS